MGKPKKPHIVPKASVYEKDERGKQSEKSYQFKTCDCHARNMTIAGENKKRKLNGLEPYRLVQCFHPSITFVAHSRQEAKADYDRWTMMRVVGTENLIVFETCQNDAERQQQKLAVRHYADEVRRAKVSIAHENVIRETLGLEPVKWKPARRKK